MNSMNYLDLAQIHWLYYAVDFLLLLLLVAGFRLFANGQQSLDKQLAEDDNFAMGITVAGALVSIAIMLMGVSSGTVAVSLWWEALFVGSYGVLGIVLMLLTRQIFDYFSFPNLSIPQQIKQHNIAVGLVDAGNMIASAIIIRAVMLWVEDDSSWGLLWVLAGFIASQMILWLVTAYRRWLFRQRHPDNSLQSEIAQGNIALAIRFAGNRIGVALAITVTSSLVIFQTHNLWILAGLWVGVALLLFIAQTLVSILVRMVFLSHINLGEEIINQKNVALGAIQAAIYIAVGSIFIGLFA